MMVHYLTCLSYSICLKWWKMDILCYYCMFNTFTLTSICNSIYTILNITLSSTVLSTKALVLCILFPQQEATIKHICSSYAGQRRD